MFLSKNLVRAHDTDFAGILYFARQFRFVHDAWEDLLYSEGFGFDYLFKKADYGFVIVHVEADYMAHLFAGDRLEVEVGVVHIGNTSFHCSYSIYRVGGDRGGGKDSSKGEERELVGTAKTVHVTMGHRSRKKIVVPEEFRVFLGKFTVSE